jgi:HD-GYP domain-containing protein (c-di-GMP phosphodiesterase class II)
MGRYKTIDKLQSRHCKDNVATPEGVRECLLFRLLLWGSFIGLLAYIPSVWASLQVGFYDIVVADTIFYVWIVYLLLSSKRSYLFRVYGFIAAIWLLSFFLVFRLGSEGAGFIWLFVAPILTGMLVGAKEGLATVVATVVLLTMAWASDLLIPELPSRTELHSTAHWAIMTGNMALLMTLVILSVSYMFNMLRRKIVSLEKHIRELSATKDATIEAIAALAEYRDNETGYHIRRTKAYVRMIAQALRRRGIYVDTLDDEYVDLLVKSAPLHDIGKIGIPDAILLKTGKLEPEEMEEMKKHTVYGREALLRAAEGLGEDHFLSLAAEIAYTHHEKLDGTGYPRGLKEEAIPLSGRIMAVADVYDALRSERSYKKALSHEESIAYLKANAGKHFDPNIIAIIPDIEGKLCRISVRFTDGK